MDADLNCYNLFHYFNTHTRKDNYKDEGYQIKLCQYQPCPNRFTKKANTSKPSHSLAVPKKNDPVSTGPRETYPKTSPVTRQPGSLLPVATGNKGKEPEIDRPSSSISRKEPEYDKPSPSPSEKEKESPNSEGPYPANPMSASQGPGVSRARAFWSAVTNQGEGWESEHEEPGGGGPGGGGPGGEPGGGGGGGGPGGRGPGSGGGGGPPGGNAAGPLGNPPQNTEGRNPKSKVKEPDIFMGERNKASEFLADLYLLFCSRPADCPTNESRVVTALSYLRGDAHWWAESKVEAAQQTNDQGKIHGFGTWAQFKHDFLLVFGEQDPAQTAAVQLGSLRYDSKERMDWFNAKILRLFIKGGITEDSAQVAWYQSKLLGFLQDKMALIIPQPTNMDQWMEATMQLNKAYLLNREMDRAQGRQTQKYSQRPHATEPAVKAVVGGRLDDKTCRELMKQNKCFYCREVGHRVVNCPSKCKGDPKTWAVDQEEETSNEAEEEPEIGLNAIEMDYDTDF